MVWRLLSCISSSLYSILRARDLRSLANRKRQISYKQLKFLGMFNHRILFMGFTRVSLPGPYHREIRNLSCIFEPRFDHRILHRCDIFQQRAVLDWLPWYLQHNCLHVYLRMVVKSIERKANVRKTRCSLKWGFRSGYKTFAAGWKVRKFNECWKLSNWYSTKSSRTL